MSSTIPLKVETPKVNPRTWPLRIATPKNVGGLALGVPADDGFDAGGVTVGRRLGEQSIPSWSQAIASGDAEAVEIKGDVVGLVRTHPPEELAPRLYSSARAAFDAPRQTKGG